MADPNSLNIIHLYGLINANTFKQAQFCAKKLALSASKYFGEPIIEKMFEFEWEYFMEQQKQKHRGEMWVYKENELIFINDELIGGYKDLLKWAENNIAFEDQWIQPLYSVLTEEDYKNQLKDKNRDLMYMYISIDNEPEGHFLIELFTDIVPKTCENFKALCFEHTTETGISLSYINTIFHRIVPNGWIQGGDVISGNGSNGRSIYGDVFEDENFAISHNKRGILGMSNHGRHTNNSQFYITLTATPWMNNRYVAFGQLLEGTELLKKMEEQLTINEYPLNSIMISKCEMLNFEETIDDNLPDFSIGQEEDEKKDEEPQEENEQVQDNPENELTENDKCPENESTKKEIIQEEGTKDENIKDELPPEGNISENESTKKEIMQEGTQDENVKDELRPEENISENALTRKETVQNEGTRGENIKDEHLLEENISGNAPTRKETEQEEGTKEENIKDELLPEQNISGNASSKIETIQEDKNIKDELQPKENISVNESTKKEIIQEGRQDENVKDKILSEKNISGNISTDKETLKETRQEKGTEDENTKDELILAENISENGSTKKEMREGTHDENIKDELPQEENISENESTKKEIIHEERTQDENVTDELQKEKEVKETE